MLACVALGVSACGGGDGGGSGGGTEATQQALIRTSPEPAGAHCPDGGTRADAGRDADGDGVLDAGEETTTAYICADAGSTPDAATLVRTRAEPAGANCTRGGTRLDAGPDSDGDGSLADSEVATTSYVCDAAPSPFGNGLARMAGEPAGANCAYGGTRIEAGLDADGNGSLDDAEVQSTAFACYAAPPPYSVGLVRYRAESPGTTCLLGGSRVEAGTDDNGNGALDDPEVDSFAFICAASPPGTPYSWRGAQSLLQGAALGSAQRVAIAPNGNGIAVWSQSDNGGGAWSLRAARYDAAAVVWTPADPLTPDSAEFVWRVETAIDPAGNAIVVWIAGDSLWARRFRAAANTWDAPVLLATEAGFNIYEPAVEMDASGNAIVSWSEADSITLGAIRARRFDAAADAWQAAVRLDDGGGIASRHKLAMAPGGEAVVAWQQESGGIVQTTSARYVPAAGSWTAPVAVASAPTSPMSLEVAINGDGRAVLLFMLGGTYASVSNASGTAWNTPVLLAGAGVPLYAGIDGFGNATVLTSSVAVDLQTYRHDGTTGTWTELTPTADVQWAGQAGMDGAGNLHAIWTLNDNLLASALPAGATGWQATVPLEIDSGFVRQDQRIAVAPDGRAIAIWAQEDGVGGLPVLVNTLR